MRRPGGDPPQFPISGIAPAPPIGSIGSKACMPQGDLIDAAWRAARDAITRQEGLERKRQARIRRQRAKRKAKFIIPPPSVSAAARIDRARLMARR